MNLNIMKEEMSVKITIIKEEKDINSLCELTIEEFDSLEGLIDKENVRNRAKHVVYENERVKAAFNHLEKGEIEQFASLLIQSHNSLRDLYQVTGIELDTIVEEALRVDGCIGARMTGAGFAGCAIALVRKSNVDEFMNKVLENYIKKIGYAPSFYLTDIGEGTGQLN